MIDRSATIASWGLESKVAGSRLPCTGRSDIRSWLQHRVVGGRPKVYCLWMCPTRRANIRKASSRRMECHCENTIENSIKQ